MLVGCGDKDKLRQFATATTGLPPAPAYAQPVHVPDPKAGESAIAVALRERQGRKRANAIIRNMVGWYGGVRNDQLGAAK